MNVMNIIDTNFLLTFHDGRQFHDFEVTTAKYIVNLLLYILI